LVVALVVSPQLNAGQSQPAESAKCEKSKEIGSSVRG
jgi:hypothetical protein